MRLFWQRFKAALTPGTATLLVLMLTVGILVLIGKLTRAFDLYGLLALTGREFWRGQGWRIITYASLPGGLAGFVVNCVGLIMLGSLLERVWSRGQFWFYCLMCIVGAGFVKSLLSSASPQPLAGAAPLMLGLVVGWAFVSGNEAVPFLMFGQMTARQAALILMLASFLITLLSAGLATALIAISGGLTGWLYLWLRQKSLMARPSRVAPSERIRRLEL